MATKGLKAIVFDGASGQKPPILDLEAFRKAQKEYTQALMANPQVGIYKNYGTAGMTRMTQAFGALPTRNFSSGQFEGAEDISRRDHARMAAQPGRQFPALPRLYGRLHHPMLECLRRRNGKMIVSPLEYETISLMGSNLGIPDLDVIARLNWQVNDLGLNSIEVGAALGVAAEAGLMKWGDGVRALELLDEIRQGTPLGRVIGSGAGTVGLVFGIERVPVVKNQAFSGYEPRSHQRHRRDLRHFPHGS